MSQSSTEAEYRAMALAAAELTWIEFLLKDLDIPKVATLVLYLDNLSALHFTVNLFSMLALNALNWTYTNLVCFLCRSSCGCTFKTVVN